MKNYILVVDDDQLILYALAKILKNDGYEVATASTGTEALEKLSYCPYDICLLDLRLPDMNGLELLSVVRDMCPDTRVVIMTASYIDAVELEENYRQAIASGANHFISKPFNLCDISELVQRVLAGETDLDKGFFFSGDGFEKKSRKSSRKPFQDTFLFQMSLIDRGDYTRKSIEAQGVDISDRGIGFLTSHPLKESQVIGFDGKLDNRTGVVVWSKMVDKENCRVGVRFA